MVVHLLIVISTIVEVIWIADPCFRTRYRVHRDISNTFQRRQKRRVVEEDGEGKYFPYKLLLHGYQLMLDKPTQVLLH